MNARLDPHFPRDYQVLDGVNPVTLAIDKRCTAELKVRRQVRYLQRAIGKKPRRR
jgi:hypothetical protein